MHSTLHRSISIGLALLAGSMSSAAFGQLIGAYDYLESIGAPFNPQVNSNVWRFYDGDETGTLMPILSSGPTLFDAAYGHPAAYYARFGYATDNVEPAFAGTAGVNDAGTQGLFVHSAPSGYVSAVFTANASFNVGQLNFTHELVQNGYSGDGLGVRIKSIIGGVQTFLGPRFLMNSATSSTVAYNFGLGGLTLNAGDQFVVLFDPNNSYLYDHGFFDVTFAAGAGPQPQLGAVPEPSTYGLVAAAALVGLVARRRLRRQG